MSRRFICLMLVLVIAAASESVAVAAGCDKDCGKDKSAKNPPAGCRVMYGSAILYDNGIAISVSSPEGWTLDDKSGVDRGLYAVFYPDGSSWESADAVLYARIVHKDECHNSTLEKVMQNDAEEPSDSRQKVTVEAGGSLKTVKGRDARVRVFRGGTNMASAYVDEDKAVAVMVLSSRTREGLEAAMPAFKEFVGTYLFVSDDVDVNRSCMQAN